MNWYRAKTILIVFFITINIILLSNLIYSTNKSNIVTPEIKTSTVQILKKNNIEINPSIIPTKTVAMPMYEVVNAVSDKNKFATVLCGEGYVNDNDTYLGTNGKLVFEGDKFIFTASQSIVENNTSDITSTPEEILNKLCDSLGINVSGFECTLSSSDDNTVVSYRNKINDYKIFDSYVTAVINKNGRLVSFEGVWFNTSEKSNAKSSLKSVTGVLIDFILQPDRPEDTNIITSLELGYTASDYNIYHASTVLVPVWQITLSDGSTYCIDTRE